MNNPTNFTKNAVDALNGAISCATQFGHDHIGTEFSILPKKQNKSKNLNLCMYHVLWGKL